VCTPLRFFRLKAKATGLRLSPCCPENLPCGVLTGAARETMARVRPRAAEIQVAERCPILRPSERRPHREQLIQRELAVKDVAAGQSVCRLEIRGRDDLSMLDERSQAGSVLLDRAEDAVRQPAALVFP